MNRFGHIGSTLILLSPFVKELGTKFLIVATLFSLTPDIDLALHLKHRYYTHNVTFAALMGIMSYFIFTKIGLSPLLSLAAFVGVCIHVFVDMLTMYKFPPLYPFYRKKVGFKLFRSDDQFINNTTFVVGVLFAAYFLSKWGV